MPRTAAVGGCCGARRAGVRGLRGATSPGHPADPAVGHDPPHPTPTPPEAARTPPVDIEQALLERLERQRYGEVLLAEHTTGPATWPLPPSRTNSSLHFFVSCSAPSGPLELRVDGRWLLTAESCDDTLPSVSAPRGWSRFEEVSVTVGPEVSFNLLVLEGDGS